MPLRAINDIEAKGCRERFFGPEIVEIERNSNRKEISTEILE